MKQYGRVLGLDIGIASCGFALLDFEKQEIVRLGVRCFEKAENPKDGSSLALPRRQKRSLRRVIRRRGQRLRAVRRLLLAHEIVSKDELRLTLPTPNVWGIRVAGLDRKLSGVEFAQALLHIAKRRGFKSSRRRQDESDPEGKRMLEGVNALIAAIEASKCRTVGEYLALQPKKRNERDLYQRTVLRKLLEQEAKLLIDTQAQLGLLSDPDNLWLAYQEAAFYQRPLQSTERLVGFCELEPTEKRAARSSYTAERFRLLQDINNFRLLQADGSERRLTNEERVKLLELAYRKGPLKYSAIRKALPLDSTARFSRVHYPRPNEESKKNPEDATFIHLQGFDALRKALKNHSEQWDIIQSDVDLFDTVATILTTEEDEEIVTQRMISSGISASAIEALLSLHFNKHLHLSLKAMHALIPHMERGALYSEACALAGYNHSRHDNAAKQQTLPPCQKLTNPVVNRALAQARKVVNAIIREHGMPDSINVELARDLGKSFEVRKEIERDQRTREAYKKEQAQHFQELFGHEPAPWELTRFRLWKEQRMRCPYSLTEIRPEELLDESAVEIDHALPYSRSYDDSWANKVLVRTSENQNKGNRTPWEHFGDADTVRWEKFCAEVQYLPYSKQRRLLRKHFSPKDELEWKERHLNDTRYICREFSSHLIRHLDFRSPGRNVFARNGSTTSQLRWLWGLTKDRAENDRHHALDAAVIASTTERSVQLLTAYSQQREKGLLLGRSKLERRFPAPWVGFREQLTHQLNELLVSRMPVRKITGQAHKETIRSLRSLRDGKSVVVQRYPLSSVNLQTLEGLWDKERNTAEYNVLRQRLEAHGNNPKEAFARPIFKPTRDPSKIGPQIKSVLIKTDEKSGLPVGPQGNGRRGMASNGSMVRADVFGKGGKFYFVPVYVADFVRECLPNRAVTANKPETEWPIMDESYRFLFSLHPNDYIELETGGRDARRISGYYRALHRGTGAITVLAHDGSWELGGIGGRTLRSLKKFQIDLFGRRFEVKGEPRHGVAKRSDREACPAIVPGKAASHLG